MGGGSSRNGTAESHPKTGAWLLGPCITKSLGRITSQMAEDISLEEEAISSQHAHSSRWMGAQPRCGPQAGWGVSAKHSGWNCGPTQHSWGGLCLSPQMAAPPTTQPRPWQPWVAFSTPWHNTPQQTESRGKPHWHHQRPLTRVAPFLPPPDEAHVFSPSFLKSWATP